MQQQNVKNELNINVINKFRLNLGLYTYIF